MYYNDQWIEEFNGHRVCENELKGESHPIKRKYNERPRYIYVRKLIFY